MSRQTLLLVLLGFGLRLFLIFPGPFESKVGFFANQADLRNYYWPAQVALGGENPYVLWANGQSGEFRADMAPLELSLFVATVALWKDPRAIQLLFAGFDAVNIVLLGVLLARSRIRLPFQIFYALGPLTLYHLVLVPQDKTIVLTLTFLLFYLLLLVAAGKTAIQSREAAKNVVTPSRESLGGDYPEGRRAQRDESDSVLSGAPNDARLRFAPRRVSAVSLAIIVAALLASFKWLSVFYLLPLLLFVSRDLRGFLRHALVFAAIVALAHVPWFPSWSHVYAFRSARVAAPMHIAPAVLLNAAGWFDGTAFAVTLLLVLLVIYALFWFKRIDIFETMALSVTVGVLWTPDMDPVHLSVVVAYLLLIVNWSGGARLIAVWGLSAWVGAVYAFSTHTGFARYGIPDLRLLTGEYGSLRMIVLSYVLFVAVLSFYLSDKLRGRAVGSKILFAESFE